MVNLVSSAAQGFQLGSGIRQQRDERQALKLGREQQELLGGLRRRSLGLGGSTPEQHLKLN